MNIFTKSLFRCLLIFLLSSPLFAQTPNKTLYVFGDSLSDPGNLYALTYHQPNGPIPNPKIWFNGHFSNGPVWIEYLAPMLSVPPRDVINFAYGGAETNQNNVEDKHGYRYPGFKNEIQLFLTHEKPVNNNQAIYLIWIGSDDYINGVKSPKLAIEKASRDLAEGLTQLIIKAHAKQIFVFNLPDLGDTPRALALNKVKPGTSDALNKLTEASNHAYLEVVKGLKAKTHADITYVDINQFFKQVLKTPARYGLTNIDQPCYNFKTHQTCQSPSKYLFWGTIHPTTQAHKLLAKYIYEHYFQGNG